jgi:hypothetical protein
MFVSGDVLPSLFRNIGVKRKASAGHSTEETFLKNRREVKFLFPPVRRLVPFIRISRVTWHSSQRENLKRHWS